jgi:hypothetical protein
MAFTPVRVVAGAFSKLQSSVRERLGTAAATASDGHRKSGSAERGSSFRGSALAHATSGFSAIAQRASGSLELAAQRGSGQRGSGSSGGGAAGGVMGGLASLLQDPYALHIRGMICNNLGALNAAHGRLVEAEVRDPVG